MIVSCGDELLDLVEFSGAISVLLPIWLNCSRIVHPGIGKLTFVWSEENFINVYSSES